MKKLMTIVLTGALCLPLVVPAASAAGAVPEKKAAVTGTTVYANDKAKIDASNAAEGYVMISYIGGKKVAIKVQITKTGGTAYTYNLRNDGVAETFPFNAGDGEYTIRVLENAGGDKYAVSYSTTIKTTLRNEYLPFLYSNQFIAYNADSQVVKTAAEVIKGKTTQLEKLDAIYAYVVNTLTYDTERAKTVASGYVPNLDQVLKDKKGICFDYASLMSAMLRSSGIPCKMVFGYVSELYHAWINVYIDGIGWVDKAVYFDGKSWSLMDPTFISNAKGNAEVQALVGNASNYTVKYIY